LVVQTSSFMVRALLIILMAIQTLKLTMHQRKWSKRTLHITAATNRLSVRAG